MKEKLLLYFIRSSESARSLVYTMDMGFNSYTPYNAHDIGPGLVDIEINILLEKVSTL